MSHVSDIWRRWCWVPFYSQHQSSLASYTDLEVIVMQCHNMDKFIGVDSSFIPKYDAIMQVNLCRSDFNMLFWMLWTCAKHSESFVTWRHCAWRMICALQLCSGETNVHCSFGEPTCTAALQYLKNTCYVHYARLPIRDSLQIACIRNAVLFWHRFDFQLWYDQNRKFWPVVIFREAAWLCAIDVMKFIGSFVA